MSKPRKPRKPANKSTPKVIEDLTHKTATRKNIPTAEHQAVMSKEQQAPIAVTYPRQSSGLAEETAQRNTDHDPQLIWRGKETIGSADLVVHAPPIYQQEKISPKALISELRRFSEENAPPPIMGDFFAGFNGFPKGAERTDFYQHEGRWQNRMILGDSLRAMASLAELEELRGKVQCIYLDPPYGIKFNSNFQWSTASRDVKDGKAEHITREPEQVKAFRDTWQDGIHSYLSYLRDRLMVARDLLTESGSIFVQIGDENVHRVRCLMDEVFGEGNFVSQITMKTTGGLGSSGLKSVCDFILWYAKSKSVYKFRKPLLIKVQGEGESTGERYSAVYEIETGIYRQLSDKEKENSELIKNGIYTFQYDNLVSSGYTPTCIFPIHFEGREFSPGGGRSWKTNQEGIERLVKASRIGCTGKSVRYRRFMKDYPGYEVNNIWTDIAVRTDKQYVVETSISAIQRCILMSTDPGDLVLDPTCGSGTTAYVAEQWGRRWITIDTSRVALALARARIMGARYPYYLLADSAEGRLKQAELTGTPPVTLASDKDKQHSDITRGFVYQRVPHITLKSIANNPQIDVIWEQFQQSLEPLRQRLNKTLKTDWQEWDIPREADKTWSEQAKQWHADWWEQRIARQQAIDAAIAARAEFETLYDQPVEDKKRVRVAGPFTVESLSPHRSLIVDENDALRDPAAERDSIGQDFAAIILENLKTAGIQQTDKAGKIDFTALTPWPGQSVCAEGRYLEGEHSQRAAIFIGPEFATVSRADLAEAAREAHTAGFDVLMACAFSFDASASEFSRLADMPVLKARMNADLHMAEDLKNTGKGNLFVLFGEPDIEVIEEGDNLRVKLRGVDVFDPASGNVRSAGADGIACWFIDTDYNFEAFFVRHAYFLGASDSYKALKTALKDDINRQAWETLHSDTSRPFPKPKNKRFAVKVINHLGDEVMKVFRV